MRDERVREGSSSCALRTGRSGGTPPWPSPFAKTLTRGNEDGKLRSLRYPPAPTVTATFVLGPPNQVTCSCSICHWKLYGPGVAGAVTVQLKVFCSPGATVSAAFR